MKGKMAATTFSGMPGNPQALQEPVKDIGRQYDA